MRTTYRRFTVTPDGTVTDRESGRTAGVIYRDDGYWRGTAACGYQTGPWLTAYRAAAALHAVAMAERTVA